MRDSIRAFLIKLGVIRKNTPVSPMDSVKEDVLKEADLLFHGLGEKTLQDKLHSLNRLVLRSFKKLLDLKYEPNHEDLLKEFTSSRVKPEVVLPAREFISALILMEYDFPEFVEHVREEKLIGKSAIAKFLKQLRKSVRKALIEEMEKEASRIEMEDDFAVQVFIEYVQKFKQLVKSF